MISITQMPNEEPVDFILRCIELKEQIILTSQTSAEINYDEGLVSCLFLRSVEKRSESDFILQEIRPVIRYQGVTDEYILSTTKEL